MTISYAFCVALIYRIFLVNFGKPALPVVNLLPKTMRDLIGIDVLKIA